MYRSVKLGHLADSRFEAYQRFVLQQSAIEVEQKRLLWAMPDPKQHGSGKCPNGSKWSCSFIFTISLSALFCPLLFQCPTILMTSPAKTRHSWRALSSRLISSSWAFNSCQRHGDGSELGTPKNVGHATITDNNIQ